MEIHLELAKFNHIKFYDGPHEYFIDGKKQKSVTTFIGEFKKPFDEDYWSARKAKELGVTQEELLKEWAFKRDSACDRGSCLHAYAENYLNNKVFPWEPEKYIARYGKKAALNAISTPLDKLREMFQTFYEESSRSLIPIKSELVVGDEELGICGMVDQLYFNKKSGKLEIWDWKTNKEIKRKNQWERYDTPINHLEVCEFNTYSLQLSMYKYLIEKITSIRLGDSYIVWFNQQNDSYQCIRCQDFAHEVSQMISARCDDGDPLRHSRS